MFDHGVHDRAAGHRRQHHRLRRSRRGLVEELGGGRRPKVVVTVNGDTCQRTSIASMGGRFLLGASAAARDAAGIAAGQTTPWPWSSTPKRANAASPRPSRNSTAKGGPGRSRIVRGTPRIPAQKKGRKLPRDPLHTAASRPTSLRRAQVPRGPGGLRPDPLVEALGVLALPRNAVVERVAEGRLKSLRGAVVH